MSSTAAVSQRNPGQRFLVSVMATCAMIAGGITLFMAIHVVIDVGGRTFFNNPLPGTLEITQYWAMVFIIMLAMAYTDVLGEHINATILTQQLSEKSKWVSDILVQSVMFLMVGVLTYFAIFAAIRSTEMSQLVLSSVEIVIWPSKIVMAIGFALFTVQLSLSLVATVKRGLWRTDV